jgi:hypothetical protein
MKLSVALTLLLSISSIQSIVIRCNFKMATFAQVTDFVYTCGGSVTFYGNSGVIDEVEGDHQNGKDNEYVEGFELRTSRVNSIPRNLSEQFKNLKAMDFTNSDILTLSAGDLQQFPELVTFVVWMNKIISIDGDLFMYNPKLRLIDFDDNLLENVGHNLIGNLRWLKSAAFQNNQCISTSANSPAALFELNANLPVKCPPLTATTTEVSQTTPQPPGDCSIRCTLGDKSMV